MQSLDEIRPVVLDKKMCAMSLLSPPGKWRGPSFELDFVSPKDSLCRVWLKLAQWLWRRRRKLKKVYDNNDDNDGGDR